MGLPRPVQFTTHLNLEDTSSFELSRSRSRSRMIATTGNRARMLRKLVRSPLAMNLTLKVVTGYSQAARGDMQTSCDGYRSQKGQYREDP